jgi:hypothetical protein
MSWPTRISLHSRPATSRSIILKITRRKSTSGQRTQWGMKSWFCIKTSRNVSNFFNNCTFAFSAFSIRGIIRPDWKNIYISRSSALQTRVNMITNTIGIFYSHAKCVLFRNVGRTLLFWLFKCYNPMYTLAGFDLTTPKVAGGHETTRPRHQGKATFLIFWLCMSLNFALARWLYMICFMGVSGINPHIFLCHARVARW